MHSDPLLPGKVVDENTDRASPSFDGEDDNQLGEGQVGKLEVRGAKFSSERLSGGWYMGMAGGFGRTCHVFFVQFVLLTLLSNL